MLRAVSCIAVAIGALSCGSEPIKAPDPAEREQLFSSGCTISTDVVDCPYATVELDAGLLGARKVHFSLPQGEAPADGWPTAVFFQGSLFSAELSFHGRQGDPLGQFELAKTVDALLQAGFAVIAPEVIAGGATFWQTNVPPSSVVWEGSSDDKLMQSFFDAIDDDDGPFGPLDSERLYATGISSGGFMTSRMAVSYPGRFKALAVHSGGYAWCSAICVLPSSMPASHPPTLFAHGLNDLVVTPGIMTMYRNALEADGVDVDAVIDNNAAHEWIGLAVEAIPAWFAAH